MLELILPVFNSAVLLKGLDLFDIYGKKGEFQTSTFWTIEFVDIYLNLIVTWSFPEDLIRLIRTGSKRKKHENVIIFFIICFQVWFSHLNTYWTVQMGSRCWNCMDSYWHMYSATLCYTFTYLMYSLDDVVHRSHSIFHWCRLTIAIAQRWMHLLAITLMLLWMWTVAPKLQ